MLVVCIVVIMYYYVRIIITVGLVVRHVREFAWN